MYIPVPGIRHGKWFTYEWYTYLNPPVGCELGAPQKPTQKRDLFELKFDRQTEGTRCTRYWHEHLEILQRFPAQIPTSSPKKRSKTVPRRPQRPVTSGWPRGVEPTRWRETPTGSRSTLGFFGGKPPGFFQATVTLILGCFYLLVTFFWGVKSSDLWVIKILKLGHDWKKLGVLTTRIVDQPSCGIA